MSLWRKKIKISKKAKLVSDAFGIDMKKSIAIKKEVSIILNNKLSTRAEDIAAMAKKYNGEEFCYSLYCYAFNAGMEYYHYFLRDQIYGLIGPKAKNIFNETQTDMHPDNKNMTH